MFLRIARAKPVGRYCSIQRNIQQYYPIPPWLRLGIVSILSSFFGPKLTNCYHANSGASWMQYIEAPAPGMTGALTVKCKFCDNYTSRNKSHFFQHICEIHFFDELDEELRKVPFIYYLSTCIPQKFCKNRVFWSKEEYNDVWFMSF